LSDFGVLDDEMPGSQPPNDGSGPYDGWDLDDLLSGGNVFVPEGLRPVARTLDALRVVPMPAELAGEAAARAAFRQIMRSGETGPAWPAGSVTGADDSRTRILPTAPAASGPRPVVRHRHRRPPQRRPWQTKALVGGAAAAIVVVGAAALASTLSGSGGHPAQAGTSPGHAVTTTEASNPGSRVEGSATQEPTAKPTPKATGQSGGDAGPGAAELCDQYFAFFRHPGASWSAEQQLGQQLSALADGSKDVTGYCLRLLEPYAAAQQASGNSPAGPGPGSQPFGNSPGSQGPQGPQAPQGPNWPAGHAGIGNSGNSGNGLSRNSPGLGSRSR
jgi:hypothetical protein